MSKYDEMKAKTKANIREAFWRMYEAKEIGRITVNEVIARCGVNRSTFYRYYADVYQVLEEIEGELLAKTERLSSRGIVSYSDMDDFLHGAYMLYNEDRRYLHCLVRQQRDSMFSEKYRRALQDKLPPFFMRDGSRVTNKDLEASIELINYGVVDIFVHWADDERMSFDKLLTLFKGISLEGIYPTMLRVYNLKPIFEVEIQ